MLITTNMFFRRRNRIVEWMNNPSPDFCAELTNTLSLQSGFGVPTFSRASTATVKDFEGLIKSVKSGEARFEGARRVENLLTYSEAFNNGAWTKTSVTINPDAELSPIGTLTGDVTNAAIANGKLAIYDVTNSSFIAIDVAYSPGDSWSRISYTFTAPAGCLSARVYTYRSGTSYVYAGVTVSPGKQYTFSFYTKSSSGNIAFWGAQVEDVTGQANQNPSEYVSNGVLSPPYHGTGVDGVKYFTTQNGNSVSSYIVTESVGSDISVSTLHGYYVEGGRTNKILRSDDFSTSWTPSNITVSNNSEVAPSGSTVADTLTATADNATILQAITGTATSYVFSVYLKRKTGTGTVSISADGTNFSTCDLSGGGWVRCTDKRTLTAASYNQTIKLATNGDEVYVWGGQSEAGTFVSSYIPTTSATVSRAADNLTYQVSGNIIDSRGILYSEPIFATINTGSRTYLLNISDAGFTRLTVRGLDNGKNSVTGVYGDGLATHDLNTSDVTTGTLYKYAINWGPSGASIFQSGVKKDSNVTPASIVLGSTISVGSSGGSSNHYGTIKNIKIWKRPMNDSFLSKITTV